MLQMPHGGASIFIQINTVGPQEEGKMPDPWDKIKILFTVVMIETKNILVVFTGFSDGF